MLSSGDGGINSRPEAIRKYPPISSSEVDSLKREIDELLRTSAEVPRLGNWSPPPAEARDFAQGRENEGTKNPSWSSTSAPNPGTLPIGFQDLGREKDDLERRLRTDEAACNDAVRRASDVETRLAVVFAEKDALYWPDVLPQPSQSSTETDAALRRIAEERAYSSELAAHILNCTEKLGSGGKALQALREGREALVREHGNFRFESGQASDQLKDAEDACNSILLSLKRNRAGQGKADANHRMELNSLQSVRSSLLDELERAKARLAVAEVAQRASRKDALDRRSDLVSADRSGKDDLRKQRGEAEEQWHRVSDAKEKVLLGERDLAEIQQILGQSERELNAAREYSHMREQELNRNSQAFEQERLHASEALGRSREELQTLCRSAEGLAENLQNERIKGKRLSHDIAAACGATLPARSRSPSACRPASDGISSGSRRGCGRRAAATFPMSRSPSSPSCVRPRSLSPSSQLQTCRRLASPNGRRVRIPCSTGFASRRSPSEDSRGTRWQHATKLRLGRGRGEDGQPRRKRHSHGAL